jgi:threonine dehydratase
MRSARFAGFPRRPDADKARKLLRKYLQPTRLVRAESLERCSGARVYLKVESDLPTGSFKPRGALYALLTTAEQRALTGVVAASTGNHGVAVAYAARFANLRATIFLPENPNPVKRARILALGCGGRGARCRGSVSSY